MSPKPKDLLDVTPIGRFGIVDVCSAVTLGSRPIWLIEYRCPEAFPGDPNRGRQVRRRLRQDEWDLDRIKSELSGSLTAQAFQGKGYLPDKRQSKYPTLADGIVEALNLTRTQPEVRKNRDRLSAQFVLWMLEHYSAIKTWDQLRPSHLQDYVNTLEAGGLAYDTVVLELAPIKLAWRHMSENYEGIGVVPRVRLRPRRKKDGDGEAYPAAFVALLLDWLKIHKPALWPMATLQALAGLRVLEAAALRHQDIDLDRGEIRIADTETHDVKTAESARTIAVCQEIIACLKVHLDSLKVQKESRKKPPKSGKPPMIFLNEDGASWTKDALVWKWSRLKDVIQRLHLAAWRGDALELATLKTGVRISKAEGERRRQAQQQAQQQGWQPLNFQAHKLRSFFATRAEDLGAEDRWIKAYIGHVAKDVLGKHYLKNFSKKSAAIARMMDGWRNGEENENRKQD